MEEHIQWRPTAPLLVLEKRAEILRRIREYFYREGVLEVDTPMMSPFPVSDPHLDSWCVSGVSTAQQHYLRTSPEYEMKRLLAAGSGSIYQIGKVFRDESTSVKHQQEFTLLEWYRRGWTIEQLMEDVAGVVSEAFARKCHYEVCTYQSLFEKYLAINPHAASSHELKECAEQKLNSSINLVHKSEWLDLLFSFFVEPQLKDCEFIFVTEYPQEQAALSQTKQSESGFIVAQRFEFYIHGVEIANGYQELTDVIEQRKRFSEDIDRRILLNKNFHKIDDRLLAALQAGLPECAGVAVGLDRLIMLAVAAKHIADVISFGKIDEK